MGGKKNKGAKKGKQALLPGTTSAPPGRDIYDPNYGMSPKLKDTLAQLRTTTPDRSKELAAPGSSDSSKAIVSSGKDGGGKGEKARERPLTRRETRKLNAVLENIAEGVGHGDHLVDATLNFSDRQNAVYKFYWDSFMRNWSRQVDEMASANRMNAENVKEMHDKYKNEFEGMDLWKWIVAAEDVQIIRDHMKDTECTIRALHGRFEILMVCITRASNEYVVVVNAYKDEVLAADGDLDAITNSIPVNASSSVVLYHLGDVCAALSKARENIVEHMPALGCEEVARHSELLDAISSCLLIVRPTFERPNTVGDWPKFFTEQKRRAVSVSIEVCKASNSRGSGAKGATGVGGFGGLGGGLFSADQQQQDKTQQQQRVVAPAAISGWGGGGFSSFSSAT